MAREHTSTRASRSDGAADGGVALPFTPDDASQILDRLQAVSTAGLGAGGVEALFEQALDAAVVVMRADCASIQRLDTTRGELELLGSRGFTAEAARLWSRVRPGSQSPCGKALRARARVVVPSIAACDWMAGTEVQKVCLATGVEAVQTTPLLSRDGAVIGMLSTHWRTAHQPAPAALRALDVLARMVADQLDRALAEQALREGAARARSARDALHAAMDRAPLATSLGMLVQAAVDALGAEARVAFFLANEAGTALHHVVGMGADYGQAVDGFEIGPESLACGLAMHTGQPVVTADVREDARWAPWLWLAERFDYRGCWSFPLHSSAGRFVGNVAFYWRQPRAPDERELALARFLTDTASVILSQHRDAEARARAEVERERLQREIEADLEAMTRLQRIGALYVHGDDLEPILSEIVDAAIAITGADFGNLEVLDAATSTLRIVAQRGFPQGWSDDWASVLDGEGGGRAALDRSARLVVEDVERSPIFAGTPALEMHRRAGVRAVQSTPLFGRSGKPLGIFSTHYRTPRRPDDRALRLLDLLARQAADIVERAQAEASLQATNARLIEADQRKNEFLAVLSHELRNPLAPIQNSIYLLDRAAPGSEPFVRARKVIERQADHLARLVDDLLDVVRITRGRVELQRERVDLRDIVRQAIDAVRPAFAQAGLELRVEHALGPTWLDADPTRIAQVVGNLLNNAQKFTAAGGLVTVSLESDSAHANLRVKDTGVGMEPGREREMFEAFAQGDQGLARSKGGLGLGLALVKLFTELHGGAVSATSEGKGRGTEFVVRLPLAPTEPSQPRSGEPRQAAARRVLIVEDNADGAQTLADVLALGGHAVQVATSGREGVAMAREHRPDVVLCDIGLPDIDGYEVARQVRAIPGLERVRLVALTGYAQPEDRELAKQAGFDEHLAKPPDPEVLMRALGTEE